MVSTKSLNQRASCQVLVEHGQALHEVHTQEVVGVLCGVDWVPEDICIRVGANRVSVAASQGSQEGWPLIAIVLRVSEALLHSTTNLMPLRGKLKR